MQLTNDAQEKIADRCHIDQSYTGLLRNRDQRIIAFTNPDSRIEVKDAASLSWMVTKYINLELGLDVYGGFPRDSLLLGKVAQDVDVKLEKGKMHTYVQRNLINWCRQHQCTYTNMIGKGPNVREHVLMTPNEDLVIIQTVNTKAFRNTAPDMTSNVIELRRGDMVVSRGGL